jgi:DNA-binding protein HU-beta
MRKADIIKQIVKDTNVKPEDVELIVESFLKLVKKNVKEGHRVDFREFGCFYPRKYAAKKGRRPLNGCKLRKSEVMIIPETVKPVFKPSKKYFACTI